MNINIICSIGEILGGQATKTKEIIKYLQTKDQVDITNLYNHKGNLFKSISSIRRGIKGKDIVVIILGTRGYMMTIPWVLMFKSKRTKVYEFVIGGVRDEFIKKNPFIKKMAHMENGIYVETSALFRRYEALGFRNVKIVPNFKSFCVSDIKDTSESNLLRICSLSRIDKTKGLDISVQIANRLSQCGIEFCFDVYGPIEKESDLFFEHCLENFPNEMKYCGVLKYEEVIPKLSSYDIYLFPTTWSGEGFPATMIDAMAAGLVIICNDRQTFYDFINNGENGWLIKDNDVGDYIEKICFLAKHKDILVEMKEKAKNESKKYETSYVLSELYNDWLNLSYID